MGCTGCEGSGDPGTESAEYEDGDGDGPERDDPQIAQGGTRALGEDGCEERHWKRAIERRRVGDPAFIYIQCRWA